MTSSSDLSDAFEVATQALSEIRNDAAGLDLNEADTRAKIIDRIFREVFGWAELHIRREQKTASGTYLDYRLESSTNLFILEAKRSGVHFTVPKRTQPQVMRRSGGAAQNPSLHAALEQVVGYCRDEGVPVGVVANGEQLVVTAAFDSPANRFDTIVFGSWVSMDQNLPQLMDLLHPESSSEPYLRERLSAPADIRAAPIFSSRLIDVVQDPDEFQTRNPLDTALSPILGKYFGEITQDPKLLDEAYISSDRQSSYGEQIDSVLEDRIPSAGQDVEAVETRGGEAPVFDRGMRETIALQTEGEVHLVIGNVGAGKTTFLHRYFDVIASPVVRQSVMPVFVDFLDAPDDAGSLASWVDEQVTAEIASMSEDGVDLETWEALQELYRREIRDLRRGVLAPFDGTDEFDVRLSPRLEALKDQREEHIARCADYIRWKYGKPLVIVFDNVDQFGHETQHHILRIAFQKARVWNTLGILAMREETFWRYRNAPPLDAYHRHIYHIAAPRIRDVLRRRLELVEKYHRDEVIDISATRGARFTNVSMTGLLSVMVSSLLGRNQENAMAIEMLSAGDTRRGLDMFRTFFLSGHTNTDEYVATLIDEGSYSVPIHHLLRGIAFGERRYYDSTKSAIDNVFDVPNDGFYSHLQKLRILRYLEGLRDIDTVPDRGFAPVGRIAEAFSAVVRDSDGVRDALDSMLQHRLVEAANGVESLTSTLDSVRITSAGVYYLNTLSKMFVYLDLVASDAPILSREWYERILNADRPGGRLSFALQDRLERVAQFLDYLEESEATEGELLSKTSLPEEVRAPLVPGIRKAFDDERKRVLRSARQQ